MARTRPPRFAELLSSIRTRIQVLIFGLKVFGAAMLAFYIGLVLNLDRPFWAMTTAFIVAQPLTGMAVAKGFYRLAGTGVGAAIAVVNLIGFAGAPELQALGFASWLATCVYLGAIDRTARAYAFVLAGYTACLIGLPSVDTPEAIFDVALARVEEIALGTLCMTLVDALILPQPAAPLLLQRLDAWRADIARWTRDVLAGTADRASARADLRRLIASFAGLDELRAIAAFDSPAIRQADAALRRFQRLAQELMSVLVAIGQRLITFRDQEPDPSLDLRPLLHRIGAWVGGEDVDPDQLRADIAAQLPDDAAIRVSDERLLLRTLVQRLDDLVARWAELTGLRRSLPGGRVVADEQEPRFRHRDHLIAVVTAVSAFLVVLACAAVWMATAWPQGATFTMMAGTICALFGIRDEPIQPAQRFLAMSILGSVVAAIYLFEILPRVDAFVPLTLVLLPVFLPLAICLQQPARASLAMPAIMGSLGAMSLDRTFAADITSFVNGAIALNLGVAVAVLAMRLGRSLGVEWETERVMLAIRRDLARLAAGDPLLDRVHFESRMHDRLTMLIPRLALADPPLARRLGDALIALRVGLNLLVLRRAGPSLPVEARQALDAMAQGIMRSSRDWRDPGGNIAQTLSAAADAIRVVAGVPPTETATEALLALAGIRHALSGHGHLVSPPPRATLETAR
jgi:uncharacterized membrane protein YccC